MKLISSNLIHELLSLKDFFFFIFFIFTNRDFSHTMVRRVWRFLLPTDHRIGGLICHSLVAWSPRCYIFIIYNYDYLYFILFIVFKILSSFVRDSSYHDMYYKGCRLLCAHKKSFNTAIPVRSLGPYIYVHYCTCIVHILV